MAALSPPVYADGGEAIDWSAYAPDLTLPILVAPVRSPGGHALSAALARARGSSSALAASIKGARSSLGGGSRQDDTAASASAAMRGADLRVVAAR